MPYFWETIRWMHKLDQHAIKPPAPCKFSFVWLVPVNDPQTALLLNTTSTFRSKSPMSRDKERRLAILSKLFEDSDDIDTSCDDIMKELTLMLNIPKGKSIVRYLLETPGVGVVENSDDIQHAIEQFLSYISDGLRKLGSFDINVVEKSASGDDLEIHLTDALSGQGSDIGFNAVCIGSMAEKTKCGYADEFDYRLDLNINTSSFIHLIHENLDLEGFSFSFPDMIQDNRQQCKHLGFYSAMIDIVHRVEKNPVVNGLEFLDHGFNDSGFLYLLFLWKREDMEMLIKVDCVPAIPLSDIWPCDQSKDPMGDSVSPQSHMVICAHKYDVSQWYLSWSVCAVEQETMAKLPQYFKDGYRLAKIVLSNSVLGMYLNSLSNHDPEAPTSFGIKNCLCKIVESKEISAQQDPYKSALEVAAAIFKQMDHLNGSLNKIPFYCVKNVKRRTKFNYYPFRPEVPYKIIEALINQHEGSLIHLPKNGVLS